MFCLIMTAHQSVNPQEHELAAIRMLCTYTTMKRILTVNPYINNGLCHPQFHILSLPE